ncbi:signal protein PDZ [Eubacterium multiforme]|uniref:PDZ domain-containing protein n=1 Tax=Eubacterium multiforme TaxID=83339 RepID=A0ABT9UWP8_9FIRM|nr:PDZ domain-containing protein [Eubacterium multiforme]MDQ0150753.1 hypothetical protein [Eubacterium multiforme]
MDLILNTLKSVAYIFISPSLLLVLIIIGIMFYLKNRKVTLMQKMVLGESINSPLELTLSQITLGIISGAIISIILSTLGVVFKQNSGIEFLLALSILVLAFKRKIINFAYLGGIIGGLSIIVTYLNIGGDKNDFLKLNITALIIVVGVIYIIQGLLIMFDGSRGSIPIFSKNNGKVIGGYMLNRCWIMPIALFISLLNGIDSNKIIENISYPSWWPIISNSQVIALIATGTLVMIPYFSISNYSSITFTKTKKMKILTSGIQMIIYGILICLISLVAKLGLAGKIFVVIMVPLIYEIMVRISNKIEDKEKPMFYSDDKGICVLEVVPLSKSYLAGIRVGDRITALRGKCIESEKEIYEALMNNYMNVELEVESLNGERKKVQVGKGKIPGMLLVPRTVDDKKKVDLTKNKINEILDKLKNS